MQKQEGESGSKRVHLDKQFKKLDDDTSTAHLTIVRDVLSAVAECVSIVRLSN